MAGVEVAHIDTAGRFLGTLQANSNLAIATFPCMSLGTAATSLPTSLTTELGTTGAFAVRGRSAADDRAVLAHNNSWILQPPDGKTWYEITALQARTGITNDTAELFLALGKPGSGTGFNGSGDDLLVGSFDWSTIPTATFDNPYVVVGQCNTGGGFLQHYPAGNPKAEIFGIVDPTQCPSSTSMERAPRGVMERLFRAVSPEPAYAMALLGKTGGGAKPALSPFGIVKPGKVNLGTFSQFPNKSGNFTNKPLVKTPIVLPTSAGGVPFKQASVLSYLQPIVNNGTPGRICYNWAYNDDEGKTDFNLAVYTKAGGLSLVARTVGTISTSESVGEEVPVVPEGALATSPQFNVKNDGSALTVCPVFDGAKYFANILNPADQGIPFDPTDSNTFPPNYDVVQFPGYE